MPSPNPQNLPTTFPHKPLRQTSDLYLGIKSKVASSPSNDNLKCQDNKNYDHKNENCIPKNIKVFHSNTFCSDCTTSSHGGSQVDISGIGNGTNATNSISAESPVAVNDHIAVDDCPSLIVNKPKFVQQKSFHDFEYNKPGHSYDRMNVKKLQKEGIGNGSNFANANAIFQRQAVSSIGDLYRGVSTSQDSITVSPKDQGWIQGRNSSNSYHIMSLDDIEGTEGEGDNEKELKVKGDEIGQRKRKGDVDVNHGSKKMKFLL